MDVEAIGHGGEAWRAADAIGENIGGVHTGLEVSRIVGGGKVQKGGLGDTKGGALGGVWLISEPKASCNWLT